MTTHKSPVNIFKVPALIIAIILSVIAIIFKYDLSDNAIKSMNKYIWYNNIKDNFINKLLKERHIAKSIEGDIDSNKVVIYVLGGTIESMEHKIEKVSFIKSDCSDCKVLFLSEPGFAGYSEYYGRLITNDEWKIKYLENYNLNSKNIEFVKIEPGFFGTLTEARIVSKIAFERGYKRLILVTSPYHTMRTWLSFQHYNKNSLLDVYIYKDNYRVNLRHMMIEYLKLNIYTLILAI